MLSRVDPDREIIVQKDAEGNCFSALADFWEGADRLIETVLSWTGLRHVFKSVSYAQTAPTTHP